MAELIVNLFICAVIGVCPPLGVLLLFLVDSL